MRRRRVKITGVGPVTPAGIGREEFWRGILEPVSRVRAYKKHGASFGPLVAAQVDPFQIEDYVALARVPKASARHTLFAIAGSILAMKDAGLLVEEFRQAKAAIVIGAALMDFGAITNGLDSVERLGVRGSKPRTIYTFNTASISGAINEVLGASARTMAMQSSCCSGGDAIGFAANLVAEGEVDLAICGGTEAPLYRFPLLELRAAGLTPLTSDMPERVDRPFDLWRTTGVVSEGAAMLVLEPEDSPRPGYSYIAGYNFANDEPNDLCSGIAAASRLALADARIRPNQVEAINAWGPGHRLIDAGEARAMRQIFGEALAGIPAVSIKGAIGNPLGAAPAIQLVTAALAQRHSLIPPTVNWVHPDPACPLNLSGAPRPFGHVVTMVNAHGLAGVNSSFILEKC
jgi:3-oxoacyl-(acyl-carrier-protein) synthase